MSRIVEQQKLAFNGSTIERHEAYILMYRSNKIALNSTFRILRAKWHFDST